MMKMSWKKYFSWQLPAAALVLALVAQGLAFGLSGVPPLRDRPDELALAVSEDPTNYRTLLFGDSITRLATVRFSLGAPGEVGNLATERNVGLVGSLFLLQRYLRVHPAPEQIVIALAPSGYQVGNEMRLVRDHLWLAFKQPDERDFLRTHVPGIELRDWLPAILNVWERLVDPFSSYLAGQRLAPRIEVGSLRANADAPVEFSQRVDTLKEEAFDSIRLATLSTMNAEALSRLCDLGKNYGFRIVIAWPPLPAQLEYMLTSDGALTELESRIGSVMAGRCDFDGFTDFNKIRTYPNRAFRRDLAHLFGEGWEQRYAVDLREYLSGRHDVAKGSATEAAGAGRSLPDRPKPAGPAAEGQTPH
jgi:hypothetical protein